MPVPVVIAIMPVVGPVIVAVVPVVITRIVAVVVITMVIITHSKSQRPTSQIQKQPEAKLLLVGSVQPILPFVTDFRGRFRKRAGIATRHEPKTGWVQSDIEHKGGSI
jgi:hypothetical protein